MANRSAGNPEGLAIITIIFEIIISIISIVTMAIITIIIRTKPEPRVTKTPAKSKQDPGQN